MLTPPLKKVVKWYERTPQSLEQFLALKSQEFGSRPEVYAQFGLNGHNGLDWGCKVGTPVYASHGGTATAQIDNSAGRGVVVVDTTTGYKTIYWHMSEPSRAIGSTWEVNRGDIIGLSGNTGFSTGPHLHYGLKFVDSNGNTRNYNNGFKGAVDPTPYLVWWNMLEFWKVGEDGKDVWLIRDGKRSLVYNADALKLIGSFADVKVVTESELDAVPDTGKVLASIDQE